MQSVLERMGTGNNVPRLFILLFLHHGVYMVIIFSSYLQLPYDLLDWLKTI